MTSFKIPSENLKSKDVCSAENWQYILIFCGYSKVVVTKQWDNYTREITQKLQKSGYPKLEGTGIVDEKTWKKGLKIAQSSTKEMRTNHIVLSIPRHIAHFMGFSQKQATMREFAILLFIFLGGYIYLHIVMPNKMEDSRWSVIPQIQSMKKEFTALEPAKVDKEFLTNKEKTLENWKQQLKILLDNKTASENSLSKLSQSFKELAQEPDPKNNSDSKIANQKADTLNSIKQELTNLETSLATQYQGFLWAGDKKWLDVVFWSLFGTLIYLFQQISDYNIRQVDGSKADDPNYILLSRRKPQYYYFICQSPFITLVILWSLSLLNLSVAGLSLSLDKQEILVALSFLLGFFNRVAFTQINLIVGTIFKDAWKQTVRRIEINPSSHEVIYGQYEIFNVTPEVKVRWSIISNPPIGMIDTSTGKFIAPPQDYYYDDKGQLIAIEELISKDIEKYKSEQAKENSNHIQNKNNLENQRNIIRNAYKQVIVKAVREDEELISSIALVHLVPPTNQETQAAKSKSGNSQNPYSLSFHWRKTK